MFALIRALALVALVALATGCATTRQTTHVEQRGFLGDYSNLKPGIGDQAQLVWFNPAVDWSRYDAVMIDSVTVWHTAETAKISAEDEKKLTDLFYAQLHDELAKDFRIVDAPQRGALRIRVAITEAKGARVVGNTVTTVLPPARVLSVALGLSTNTAVWVGKAAIEASITDSMTSQRLAAAVDERAGAKTLRGLGDQWKDVENAFGYWAERIRIRLSELRAQSELDHPRPGPGG